MLLFQCDSTLIFCSNFAVSSFVLSTFEEVPMIRSICRAVAGAGVGQ